jgi:hypothetical protein
MDDKSNTQSNLPKESLRRVEQKLTEEQKDYIRHKDTIEANKNRKELLKIIEKKTPGCSKATLEYLGPFGADDVMLFYEHSLFVNPKYLKDQKISTLCKALNRGIESYKFKVEQNTVFVSLHDYLKNNILDLLLLQIENETQ